MNKKGILIAAVAVLVIAIIGVTYLLFTKNRLTGSWCKNSN